MSKVICIVDNSAKPGSELKTEHGLSFWIETPQGNVLFDSAQTPEVLFHNLDILRLNITDLSALVLSHAHFDHTGGVGKVLEVKPELPTYGHKNIFTKRYHMLDGKTRQVGFSEENEISLQKSKLTLSEESKQIVQGLWTTGHIKVRNEQLGSSPFLYIQKDGILSPDPYDDDLSLVLETREGLAVICGCCHAGILNTLYHIKENFKGKIHTVIGGIHLVYANEEYLDHIFEIIKAEFPATRFLLNHCTGDKALERFEKDLGHLAMKFSAGRTVEFQD
mgnify:CR=1 FL=1